MKNRTCLELFNPFKWKIQSKVWCFLNLSVRGDLKIPQLFFWRFRPDYLGVVQSHILSALKKWSILTQIILAKTSGVITLFWRILSSLLFVWLVHKTGLVSWMNNKKTVFTILVCLRYNKKHLFSPFCNKQWKIKHVSRYIKPFN